MQLMKKEGVLLALVLWILALSAGCSPGSELPTESTLAIAPPINPYQSTTSTPSVPTQTAVIPTEAPLLPSATPFIHQVQPGDTLYGLAIQYNISLDKLVAANLGVDTSLLSIGTELVIPLSEEDDLGIPTPTPYPLQIDLPVCYPSREGDLWCLLLVENDQDQTLENISAAFNLYQRDELVRSQVAIPPLNYLYPGDVLPVSALITDAEENEYQISAVLLTALPSERESPLTEIIDYSIAYSLDNTVATITGSVKVLDTEISDQQIWIAAIGFNNRSPIGIRKWISTDKIEPDTEYTFEIILYSLGPRIDQVQLFSELH